ncbi:MAG: Tat pathway signal sequence domain protein, partial [Brevundimonas sp.]
IVIPRAGVDTSGGNFEILVGFDVTPEMAEFNRSGSRFRVNAGTTPATPSPASAPSQ